MKEDNNIKIDFVIMVKGYQKDYFKILPFYSNDREMFINIIKLLLDN